MTKSIKLDQHLSETSVSPEVVERLHIWDISPEYRNRVLKILSDFWVTLDEAWDSRLMQAINTWDNSVLDIDEKWRKKSRTAIFNATDELSKVV